MKYALGLLSLAFLLPPAVALADATPLPAPPPGASSPAAADERGFPDRRRANHAQFERIMLQARSQMLGALSGAHRALLANVVGQLAVATNPDPAAAAKQLDAALSPSENKAVLAAQQNAHAQMRGLMQGMPDRGPRARDDGPAGPMGPAPGAPRDVERQHEHGNRTPDAGRILLRLASFSAAGLGPR